MASELLEYKAILLSDSTAHAVPLNVQRRSYSLLFPFGFVLNVQGIEG